MNKRLRLFIVAIAALVLIAAAIAFTGASRVRAQKEIETRLEALQRGAAAGPAGRQICEQAVTKVEQDLATLEADEAASDRVKKGYRALGDCQMQLGRARQAVDAYAKVVFFEPEQGRAHGDLARAYSRAGDHTSAIRHGRLAVQLSPTNWQAHRVLARVLEAAAHDQEALASMRKAAQLAPAEQQVNAQKAVARLEEKAAGATRATGSATATGGEHE